MPAVDLNQMLVFAAVVREGSFTAAARALGQPKSTVSKRVGQLEDRLGTRLLHRSTRRIRLTGDGEIYYEHCRRVAADAEEADRAVTGRDDAIRGTVRMTAPLAFGGRLGPVLERFLREHPAVSLELSLTDRRVDLEQERFDLAIRVGPLGDSSLVARRIGATESWLCASPRYLRGRPAIRRPADLREHDCVLHRPTADPVVWTFERGGRRVSVPVAGRYAVSSLPLAYSGARAGLGIANLPKSFVEKDLRARRLVRLLADWTTRRGELHLLFPGRPQVRPAVRALVDRMSAWFRPGS
ncbi:MAG TPA: LysR family transcriptional regulator [Kofleriaceae bacterium]|nr:LysR family transcriptional regulator [Kofleriaceae bacterium]